MIIFAWVYKAFRKTPSKRNHNMQKLKQFSQIVLFRTPFQNRSAVPNISILINMQKNNRGIKSIQLIKTIKKLLNVQSKPIKCDRQKLKNAHWHNSKGIFSCELKFIPSLSLLANFKLENTARERPISSWKCGHLYLDIWQLHTTWSPIQLYGLSFAGRFWAFLHLFLSFCLQMDTWKKEVTRRIKRTGAKIFSKNTNELNFNVSAWKELRIIINRNLLNGDMPICVCMQYIHISSLCAPLFWAKCYFSLGSEIWKTHWKCFTMNTEASKPKKTRLWNNFNWNNFKTHC